MNWRHWLPSPQQMSNAAQLRSNAYGNSTMQQALGMIVVLSVLAGLLPFVMNWFMAARVGTVLPLAQAVRATAQMQDAIFGPGLRIPWPLNLTAVGDLYQTLAGLEQPLPSWVAAGVSAFGEWLNWPVRWLTAWIVYGAFVMVANKTLGGGTTTMQRFYASTGYAAVPLLLTSISWIPCLGALASAIAFGWSLVVYIRANCESSGLTLPRAIAAVLLPIPAIGFFLLLAIGVLFAISTLLSL